MLAYDIVRARGHSNIRALHRTTLEITKDEYVTPRGDCIIACKADKSVADLSSQVKNLLRQPDSFVILVIRAGEVQDMVLCEGSPSLRLTDARKIVVRKSTYVDDATLCIRANKAAADLDRRLVSAICLDEAVEVEIIVGRISEIKRLLRVHCR